MSAKLGMTGWEGDLLGIVQVIDYTTKWYIHKLESARKNETHRLWDFEVQTNHPILAWKQNVMLINKKKNLFCGFCHFGGPRS